MTFDNLEIKNEEVDNSGSWPPRSSISINGGSNITIQNCYIHGWSIQNPVAGSDYSPTGGIAFYNGSVGGVVTNCVLDGSPESDSGVGIYGGSSVQGNVIENVPNGIVVTDPAANVSGNQVFDVPYSVDPFVSSNSILVYSSGSIFNNVVHDLVEGASAIYLEAGVYQLGNTQYVYNNLVWNVGDHSPITVASDAMGPSATSNQFIYNNTLSGGTTAGCVSVIPKFLRTHESDGSKQPLYFRTAEFSGLVLEQCRREFRLRPCDQSDLREQCVDDDGDGGDSGLQPGQ